MLKMTVKDAYGVDQEVNILPPAGQALAAASQPVVLASDQPPVPVLLPAGVATDVKLELIRLLLAGGLEITNDAGNPIPVVTPAGLATDAKLEAIRLLLAGGIEISNDAGNPIPVVTPAGLASDAKLELIRLLLAGGLEITNDAGNPIPVATPAGLATDAKLELIRLLLAGGIEITNDAGNPIPVNVAGGASAANQEAVIAAIETVGTRAYAAGVARLAYAAVSAPSVPILATEVTVHNCGAGRCFIVAGADPIASTNDMPIEPGQNFTLRITSGHKIAAVQDTAAGNLNIVPVA